MFLDPGAFPFLADLEASWRDIRDECAALPPDAFDPWVQRDMYGAGWDVYGLVAFGYDIREALARCPRTAAAIAKIPHLTTAGFSRLAPGAHIEPHVGWVKTVYRAHLGLVVPSCRRAPRTARSASATSFVPGVKASPSCSTTPRSTKRGIARPARARCSCSTSRVPGVRTRRKMSRRQRCERCFARV